MPSRGSDGLRLHDPTDCGPDGYPPIWHKVVKHAVREAAGQRCVRCLHPYLAGSGEWSSCDERCLHDGPFRRDDPDTPGAVQAQWRVLTVHHLNGVKWDLRWWNLVALCQRCHLQIQGKVQMERIWPWEHSEWVRPYAAGYYASVYLGEDLTRPEVEARLDELLHLERIA